MKTIFILLLAALSSHAQAPTPARFTDDRDLSRPAPRFNRQLVATDLTADKTEVADDPNGLTVTVLREDHGRMTPVEGLTFAVGAPTNPQTTGVLGRTNARGQLRVQACPANLRSSPGSLIAALKDDRVNVTNGSRTYRVVTPNPCHGSIQLSFKSDSPGGQALGIWQVASRAKQKVAAEIGLDFWKSPIVFEWPAEGDYYDMSSVHITRGDYWDVVGHEMGHAIYDRGGLGVFGGGAHKIDECYSEALALSEGWASYFSAWVSLDLRDPDAKFEFMVPRRAPIRIENVPADVCRGTKNEWRVTGFFWDLIDQHADPETVVVPFKAVWQTLQNSHAANMDQVRTLLLRKGFDPAALKSVWDLNF